MGAVHAGHVVVGAEGGMHVAGGAAGGIMPGLHSAPEVILDPAQVGLDFNPKSP